MNKLMKQMVTAILLRYPETKDNDKELIVNYWKQQMSDEQHEARMSLKSVPTYSLESFFNGFMTGKFENPDSITRTRRLLQQRYPHLRGTKYHIRDKHQEKVKEELGYAVVKRDNSFK